MYNTVDIKYKLSNVWSSTLSKSKYLMWYLSYEILPLIGLVFWVGLSYELKS